jgi:hypothetical protein
MRCYKKAMFRTAITGTLAMASLAIGLATEASAECLNLSGFKFKAGAVQPISWQGTGGFGPGSLLLVADRDDSVDGIVGFWRVTYVSKGNSGIGIPDGTVIDEGLQQWHSDGTEIHNDTQSPAARGNVCLGIWKKTGRSHYQLNHFFQAWDPTNNSLHDRVQIREEIDLDRSGDEHFGTLTIDDYDPHGNLLVHLQGTVHATRITVKTDLKDLF